MDLQGQQALSYAVSDTVASTYSIVGSWVKVPTVFCEKLTPSVDVTTLHCLYTFTGFTINIYCKGNIHFGPIPTLWTTGSVNESIILTILDVLNSPVTSPIDRLWGSEPAIYDAAKSQIDILVGNMDIRLRIYAIIAGDIATGFVDISIISSFSVSLLSLDQCIAAGDTYTLDISQRVTPVSNITPFLRYTASAPVEINIISGLLKYQNSISDFSFTYTVSDPFGNSFTDIAAIAVIPPISLSILTPDQLLAYEGIPWQAALLPPSGGLSSPIPIAVSSPFLYISAGNIVQWNSPISALNQPLIVTATEPKCTSVTVSFTSHLTVLMGLPPVFRPFDAEVMQCYEGIPWSVQLADYLFHLYFATNQLSISIVSGPAGVIIDSSLVLSWANPAPGPILISLSSCSPELYCVPVTYSFTCLSPLSITLNSLPASLYIGQELHEISPNPIATVWQSSLQVFNMDLLAITLPKPKGLLIDSTGALWWRPKTADTFSFTISAELKGSPVVAGKKYTDVSSVYLVDVLPNAVPTLTLLQPLESAQRCFISLLHDNCVLNLISALQPIDVDNDLITCDSQQYPVISNVLTWDRSLETTTSPSAWIQVRCKDTHSAYVLSLPFRLYPDFQPVISDLSPNDLTATVGFIWSRSFTISADTVQYPSDPSQLLSIAITPDIVTLSAPGVLLWNPAIGLEGKSVSITIAVVWNGNKPVTVSRTYAITVDSTLMQAPVCSDLTIAEKTILMNAVSTPFELDLPTKCASPVSHALQYTLITAPTGLILATNKVTWTPATPEERVQVIIAVKDMVYSHEIVTNYRFDLIPRCDFTFDLSELRATPGEIYRFRVLLDSFCAVYMSISDFSYGMTVSGPNLTPPIPQIDPNFGLITWEVPTDFSYIGAYLLYITLTQLTAPSDPANSQSKSFTLLIDPRIDQGIPVVSTGTDTASVWNAGFTCKTSVSNPSFTASFTSPRVSFTAGSLSYTPVVGEYSSELVTIRCSDGVLTSLYSLVISPIKQITLPVCLPQSFTVTENQLNIGKIAWTDIDSFPQEIVFTLQSLAPSGFSLYSWGAFDYIPAQGGTAAVTIKVSDGISDVTISVDFTITEVNDAPSLTPIPTQVLDRLLGQTSLSFSLSMLDEEETGTLQIHYSYSDTLPNDLSNGGSAVDFTWTPEADVSYRKVTFWVEDSGALLSQLQPLMLCQGVKCRKLPEIIKVETTNSACAKAGSGIVSCRKTTPEELILIQVSGYNLDTTLYIAYRECIFDSFVVSPTDFSYKTVTCELPYPPPIGSTAFIYGETSGLTGFAKDFVSYSLPSTPNLVDYLLPGQKLVIYGSGTCTVPVYGQDLSPHCSCFASVDGLIESIPGTFIYLGRIYSTCDFAAGTLTPEITYYIRLNCGYLGVTTSTQLPFIYLNLGLIPGPSPIISGHDHGGYSIPIEATGLFTCFEDLVLVSFMQYAIKPVSLCDDSKARIVIPPYEAAWGRVIVVRLSLNGGLTYTEVANSFQFTYTGPCSNGSFANASICSPCPPGHYCPTSHSNYYLQAPIPCDLGSYQPLSSHATCHLCEPGYQCFCRGLANRIICDAGFVCDSYGTIRRSKPCPPGYYCEAGTISALLDLKNTNSQYPIPCPQDTYCKIGAYQSSVNIADPYTPQPCDPGFFCPKGSSNSFVSLYIGTNCLRLRVLLSYGEVRVFLWSR